ncbi:MAG: TldD/PmbA family protein [Elusimicrobiota bacterium]
MRKSAFLWEIFSEESENRQLGWTDGHPSLQVSANKNAACARVIKNGKLGIFTMAGAGKKQWPGLIKKAESLTPWAPVDKYHQLAPKESQGDDFISNDRNIFKSSPEDWFDRFRLLEKKLKKLDSRIKKIIKFQTTEKFSTRFLSNSWGHSFEESDSFAGFSVEILANEGSSTEVAWDFSGHRFIDDVNVENLAEETAKSALQSLGGSSIVSGSYTLLLHPRVVIQLMSLLENALSAASVLRNRSFLKNKLGEKIASSVITVFDDPHLEKGAASRIFDDEGVRSKKISVIENGFLKNYFYDLKSSAEHKTISNGRAAKPSIGAIPIPQSTNFFIEPSDHTFDHLISSDKKVFLVHEVMGLHMADPVTGEFSLGASGFLYQDGKFKKPVRGVTIAGTILEIFKKVSHAGRDFTWYSGKGAPSLLVKDIIVSGN